GKTVIGVEEVVENRDPGVLTGLELRPGSINLSAGGEVPLEVWGSFSAGGPCRMFTSGMQFQSSNTTIATISAQGVVKLLTSGAASVSVDDGASHTASMLVTVLPAAPVITSPEVATAVVGQSLSYQIIASNSPTQYEADELPTGLVLNASTGLLSGTLNAPGTLLVRLGASNATGTGRSELRLLVDPGSSQAPQDIALDAAAVPANQAAGTAVGILAASDPNPADVNFTYTLVAGTGADDNGLFAISGSQLLTSALLNPVSKPLCRVRVRCTDQGGLFIEKAFELPVLGVPVIVTQPQGAQGMAGTDAGIILAIEARGYGPLSYEWKLNGQTVGWAKEPVLELNPDPWSAGDWTVTVSNSYGSVTSQVAVVTVQKMSYSLWAYQNANWLGAQTALMDDPGGLGVPNLLRFALAGSAAGGVSQDGSLFAALPQVVHEGGSPVLKFMKAADADVSAFRVMLSPDLQNWSEYTPAPADVTTGVADDPFSSSELIRMNLPVMPKVFFRLEAEE
ncbi:MAG: Ig domain-containing protein, partial [Akkermansiaceae bacterium]|nr:Ig domain-containing protein [Akkermansiaceae bacterium]